MFGEHDPGADVHGADAGVDCRLRLRLPSLHDAREEVVARRAVLGEDFVAARAVVPDRRTGHEHAWLVLATRDRTGEHGRALHAALEDAVLLLVGPALVADPLAREVHHRVDALERGRVDQTGLGIPPDVVAPVTPPRCSRSTR